MARYYRRSDPWEIRPESAATTVIDKAKSAIGSLGDTLKSEDFKKEVGIVVSEVFKGGSLGQGTQVPHNYDIDLVLYTDTLTVDIMVEDRCRHKEWINKTRDFLKKHSYGKEYGTHPVKIDKDSEPVIVGIKFIYPFFEAREEISVDLFLSPNFRSLDKLLTSLQDLPEKQRRLFSTSASKWQTKFYSGQRQWIKEFSRRLKAWRNDAWKDDNGSPTDDGRPISYLLSILVVIAFSRIPEDIKKQKKGKMKRVVPIMTQKLKELVLEIRATPKPELDLIVPVKDKEFRDLRRKYEDLLPPRPRIIDPTNPANNLYYAIKKTTEAHKWDPFARKVGTLDLSPRLMNEVMRVYH